MFVCYVIALRGMKIRLPLCTRISYGMLQQNCVSLMGTSSILDVVHPSSIDDVPIKLIQSSYYYMPKFMSNRLV